MSYINGQSFPKIRITNTSNVDLPNGSVINLELCGEGGLVESYAEDFKRITLRKDKRLIDYDYNGSRIRFALDYSDYIEADMLFVIESIYFYNSRPDLYKLWLYPRADKPQRFFEVRLETGAYDLALLPQREGHTLPILNFISSITQSKNFQTSDIECFPSPYFAIS